MTQSGWALLPLLAFSRARSDFRLSIGPCVRGRDMGGWASQESHSLLHRCCTKDSGRSGAGGGSSTFGTTAGGRPCGSPTSPAPSWGSVRWSLAWEEDWAAAGGPSVSLLLWGVGSPAPGHYWAPGSVGKRWVRVSLLSIEQAAQAQRAGRSKARQVSSQKVFCEDSAL